MVDSSNQAGQEFEFAFHNLTALRFACFLMYQAEKQISLGRRIGRAVVDDAPR